MKLTTEVDTPKRLKAMSENVLQLITTTMTHMDPVSAYITHIGGVSSPPPSPPSPQVLWPSLLEFLSPVQYIESVSIVCRCVAAIAGKKRESNDEDYEIDFEELGYIHTC